MNLSIQQFQSLNQITNSDLDEFGKAISLIASITGKSISEVEAMDLKKLNKASAEIIGAMSHTYARKIDKGKPQRYIKTNDQWYELHYDITKHPYNAGRYVEIMTFSKDIIGNLHKIMASIATPVRYDIWSLKFKAVKDPERYPHDRIALDMLSADVSIAYHSSVFFYLFFRELISNSADYLIEISKDKKMAKHYLTTLISISDGYIQPLWYRKWKDARSPKHGKFQSFNI